MTQSYDIFKEVLTETKKSFTKVKQSVILNTLKENEGSILYKYTESQDRGKRITFYSLKNNKVLKNVYQLENGKMLLNAFKNRDDIKLIELK